MRLLVSYKKFVVITFEHVIANNLFLDFYSLNYDYI